MVERVAKAIYDKPTAFDGDTIGTHLSQSMMLEGSATSAGMLHDIIMSVCRDAARSAIEAMRTPTEAMYHAAWAAEVSCSYTESAHAWSAMIDAALSEP